MNMIHFSGQTDISRSFIPESRRYLKNREEKFVHHGSSKISGSQQTVVSQIYGRRDEKIDMHDFPVHDCTQEQNVSPYFPSVFGQMQMAVSFEKGCLPWNMISHFSSLLVTGIRTVR